MIIGSTITSTGSFLDPDLEDKEQFRRAYKIELKAISLASHFNES